MYKYIISGNTGPLYVRELIKVLVPFDNDFKKWWKYKKALNQWELEVANKFHTDTFIEEVKEACRKYKLKFKILEVSPIKFQQKRLKSIKEFDSDEEFFDYFHKLGIYH